MFFLNNYKGICHIFGLMVFFGFSYIFFPQFLTNPVYDLVLVVGCFFVTNFAIKYVGLDVDVKKELDKAQKEKSDN